MVDRKQIRKSVVVVAQEFSIKKEDLFGSYADGTYGQNSDVDLLVEFMTPTVSLLKISGLKHRLEEMMGIPVDILHAPVCKDALITIEEVIPLYPKNNCLRER